VSHERAVFTSCGNTAESASFRCAKAKPYRQPENTLLIFIPRLDDEESEGGDSAPESPPAAAVGRRRQFDDEEDDGDVSISSYITNNSSGSFEPVTNLPSNT
jgi:hypothetical protein